MVPACSSVTLTNVLSHWNLMLQMNPTDIGHDTPPRHIIPVATFLAELNDYHKNESIFSVHVPMLQSFCYFTLSKN